MANNVFVFDKEGLKNHDENLIDEFVKTIEREMPYYIYDRYEAMDTVYQVAKAFNRR